MVAEAAIPGFVVGIAIMHRAHLGRLGTLSAWAYASSYTVFTYSAVYALVNGTKDYATLSDDLGRVMIVPGAVMVLAGLGFGYAEGRARRVPTWTAVALAAGVVLVAVAQGLPEGVQLIAAAVRDLGFAGMGAAMLSSSSRQHAPARSGRANNLQELPAPDPARRHVHASRPS